MSSFKRTDLKDFPGVYTMERDLVPFHETHSILVSKPDHYGDAFSSLRGLSLLLALFPSSEVTMLCSPWTRPIFEAQGVHDFIEVEYFSNNGVLSQRNGLDTKAKEALFARRFDLFLDFRVVGDTPDIDRCVRAKRKFFPKFEYSATETVVNLVSDVFAQTYQKSSFTSTSGKVALFLEGTGPNKVYPHADALRKLLDEEGIPHEDVGPDRFRIQDLPMALKGQFRACVGVDTGPTHAAGLSGIPVVEIFGGLVGREWIAHGNVTAIGREVPCSPCFEPRLCKSHSPQPQCLSVPPEAVVRVLREKMVQE